MKQFNARCLKCNFSPTKADVRVKQRTSGLKTCTRLLGTALTMLIRPHYKTDPVPFFLIYFFGSSIQTESSSVFLSGNRRGKKTYFCNCCRAKGRWGHVTRTTVWGNWSVTHTVGFSTSNSSKTVLREILHSLLGTIKARKDRRARCAAPTCWDHDRGAWSNETLKPPSSSSLLGWTHPEDYSSACAGAGASFEAPF